MAKLKETTSKFDELKVELSKFLEDIGEKLQDAKFDGSQGSAGAADELRSISEDVDSKSEKVAELSTVGEEILAILEALDCKDTPKGRDIESTILNTKTNFSSLQQTIQTKQKKLDERMFQSAQQWVTKHKKSLNDLKPVSLDRDLLNQQIQSHRDLKAEIQTKLLDIELVKERFQDKPANIKKYKTLVDNVGVLNGKVEERGAILETVSQKLEPFHLAVYQLESWYTYAIHYLKQESMDSEFLFTKIDNIYKQREEKLQHLKTVKDVGQSLVSETNFDDKEKFQSLVDDVDKKTQEIQEQLATLVQSAAALKIESFGRVLEKAVKDVDGAETPSADPEVVTKQYTDQQAAHAQLKKSHKLAVESVTKYKNMFKSLREQDPAEIQNKWSGVQKDFTAVSKRIEERLGVLEEAQPAQLSADIDMEVLQDWIEVDTAEGEEKKKKLAAEAKAKAAEEKNKKKSSSSSSKTPPKGEATPPKAKDVKKEDKKKPETKKENEKAEERSQSKKVDKTDPKKKDEKEKNDAEKAKPRTAERKASTDKKEDKPKEKPVSKEKKEEVKGKTSESDKTMKKDSKEADKKPADKKEDTKPNENSKSSKEKPSSNSSKEKDFVVTLRAGQRNKKSLENGIVILDIKKETKFSQVMAFVKPHVPKIGLVKFFRQPDGFEYVFISFETSSEVKHVISKLNGTQLAGKTIEVKKAHVKFAERVDPHKSPKPSKSKSEDGTIFDTPDRGGKGKDANSDSKKDPKKSGGKDQKKGGILTLEEIKQKKQDDLMRQRQRRATEEAGRRPGPSANRDHGPQWRGSRSDDRLDRDTNKRRKTIITLTELRGEREKREIRGREDRDLRQVIGRPDDRLVDSVELQRERQRVRLEQEQLERERIQAERERVALERERQKRELDRLRFADDLPRGMKRAHSPLGYPLRIPPPPPLPSQLGGPKQDGTYWMPPKRPALDRDPPSGGSTGSGHRAERRQVSTTYHDQTLSHLRFDDMRAASLTAPPPANSSLIQQRRPPLSQPIRRPAVPGGPQRPANSMPAGREQGMAIQRIGGGHPNNHSAPHHGNNQIPISPSQQRWNPRSNSNWL